MCFRVFNDKLEKVFETDDIEKYFEWERLNKDYIQNNICFTVNGSVRENIGVISIKGEEI